MTPEGRPKKSGLLLHSTCPEPKTPLSLERIFVRYVEYCSVLQGIRGTRGSDHEKWATSGHWFNL